MIDKLAAQDDMQQKTEKSDWTFRILRPGHPSKRPSVPSTRHSVPHSSNLNMFFYELTVQHIGQRESSPEEMM